MPDWSYKPFFRPLLFQLPSRVARSLTLGAMGTLSRIPGGSLLIRTLGHMELFPILEQERWGYKIQYPIGLGGGLDPTGYGQRALSQFGFGYVEIGPITPEPIHSKEPIAREVPEERLLYPEPLENEGAVQLARRLKQDASPKLPQFIRLHPMQGATTEQACQQIGNMADTLHPYASGFFLDIWDEALASGDATAAHISSIYQAARAAAPDKPLLLVIPLNWELSGLEQWLKSLPAAQLADWDGFVLGDGIPTQRGYEIGPSGLTPSLQRLKVLKPQLGESQTLIASSGVHQPQDALELMHAGADMVQLHSGLVYSGPGLPKRVNEAVIYERLQTLPPAPATPFWRNWGWMCLLGLGMILTGVIAWIIAATSVLLPYDEAFLGMTREELQRLNPRLLSFMSHDRITLAGTSISIGVLYYQLARYGLSRELHWARTALLASGLVGFSSFFLYLGYGYLDPLHALAAAILLPMFVLSMRGAKDRPSEKKPNLTNSRAWRMALWGQFLFVILGFALAIGGLTIAYVGVTEVFVHTDLHYLEVTPELLQAANDRLIPLIAHDRAGFGGALFSNAVALLAIALWGIGQGERWLWWTLLAGGVPAFYSAISVHLSIGYMTFVHLLPVYFACSLYAVGLILLFPYLMHSETAAHSNQARQTKV